MRQKKKYGFCKKTVFKKMKHSGQKGYKMGVYNF